jgi:hypothetical protein
MKIGLQIIQSFQSCVIYSGYSGNIPASLATYLATVFFLNLAYYTYYKKHGCN